MRELRFDPPYSFNPLSNLQPIEEVRGPLEASLKAAQQELSQIPFLLQEELGKLGINHPDDFLFGPAGQGLSRFTFHIIANEAVVRKNGDDFKAAAGTIEVLELEPLDFKSKPEKAAWAVQNQAFFAFRHEVHADEEEAVPPLLKMAPTWADMIRNGQIKQLKMRNASGEAGRQFRRGEVQIAQFTAEEIDGLSKVIYKAVDIAYKIRQIEAQLKKEEKLRMKELKDLEDRARMHRENLDLKLRAAVKNASLEPQAEFEESRGSQAISEAMLEHACKKRTKELKEEKSAQELMELHQAIISRAIKNNELKREILKHESRAAQLQRMRAAEA